MIGVLGVSASVFIFIYCTVWLITPVLHKESCIQDYFLDISVLQYGPLILLAVALLVVGAFLYYKT